MSVEQIPRYSRVVKCQHGLHQCRSSRERVSGLVRADLLHPAVSTGRLTPRTSTPRDSKSVRKSADPRHTRSLVCQSPSGRSSIILPLRRTRRQSADRDRTPRPLRARAPHARYFGNTPKARRAEARSLGHEWQCWVTRGARFPLVARRRALGAHQRVEGSSAGRLADATVGGRGTMTAETLKFVPEANLARGLPILDPRGCSAHAKSKSLLSWP
jgi:hypothetical protein